MDHVSADTVVRWLREAALPLWAGAGFDSATGNFVERLTLDGEPDTKSPRRVRVQARQIYVYSHAALLGHWPKGLDLAWRTFDHLKSKAWRSDGGWVHILDSAGNVVDGKRDTYDHAFMLYAMAWLYRATKDRRALETAERTLAAVDAHLWDAATESYWQDDKHSLPRGQNPHMHLLEAFLALHGSTGDARYLDRVKQILELFREVFFLKDPGILREYFTAEWRPDSPAQGQAIEPGHHLEWTWLLTAASAATGKPPLPERKPLYDFAMAHGLEVSTRLAIDELTVEGKPKLASKRCWPQTEGLKAALVMDEDPNRALAAAQPWLDNLFKFYLAGPVPGGWMDRFDERNRPVAEFMPASTFYHVFFALSEYLRVAGSVHR